MAIDKIDFPTSGTPSLPTDYTNQNENLERTVRATEFVSLTNWDDGSSAPEVIVGSVVESNGILYDVITANEAISTTGASAGIVYLKFDDTASAEEFVWTNTAPTWSATLNGWYISGDKCTGHRCRWDGSTLYTDKCRLPAFAADDVPAPPGYALDDTGQTGLLTLPTGTTSSEYFWLPVGYIQFSEISNGSGGLLNLLVTNNRSTTNTRIAYQLASAASGFPALSIISNGNNYCFNRTATSGSSTQITYFIFR